MVLGLCHACDVIMRDLAVGCRVETPPRSGAGPVDGCCRHLRVAAMSFTAWTISRSFSDAKLRRAKGQGC
jgi:hypothetical protein